MSDAATDHLLFHVSGGILTVRFNRPAKKNAFTEAMYEALAARLRSADEDPEVRVILLGGEGGAFTAGNDLADFMERPPTGEDSAVFRFLHALLHAKTPIVAAVRGAAVGIGTTMLLHADLVYASESAKFSLPFVNLGLCPEAASSLILPRQIGHARAAELLMLGEPFDPVTAREAGIVTRVVEDDAVEATGLEAATKLAARPQASLRLTKELMRRWDRDLVSRAMAEEGEAFVRQLVSPEAREAFAAFMGRGASKKAGA